MNIFDLTTFFIIIMAGLHAGRFLALFWHGWGWILGVPLGMFIAGVILFLQFHLLGGKKSSKPKFTIEGCGIFSCVCGKDYLKVDNHYVEMDGILSILNIVIILTLIGIPIFWGGKIYPFVVASLTNIWVIWGLVLGLPWLFVILAFTFSLIFKMQMFYLKHKCKTRNCKEVEHTEKGDLLVCTCGKKYLEADNRLMELLDDGSTRPYRIRRKPGGPWEPDTTDGNLERLPQ